jgi:hypothetical protein
MLPHSQIEGPMRITHQLALFSVLGVMPLTACDCGETLQVVAPKVLIGPVFPVTSLCAVEEVRDCAHDFGEVAIGQGSYLRFTINNPTGVALTVRGIAFAEGSDPSFVVEGEAPKSVEAGSDVGPTVTVKFVPEVEGAIEATLVVDTDGANLNPGEKILIHLSGTGMDLGQPRLVVTPAACDFGDVGVGVTATCDVTLTNEGPRDLEINAVSFSDATDTDVFGSQTIVAIPTFIATGTGKTITLYATPSTTGEILGTFTVGSNDPLAPSVDIPLSVTGAQAPTAIPEIATLNGQPYTAGAPIQPLDDVILTGLNSVAASSTGSIVSYHWAITSKPAESTVQLTAPDSMQTGFYFQSAGGNYQGLDVVGTFEVLLTVTDNQGAVSTNDARLQLASVPTEGLHVQLTWDVAQNDIDMHLLRNSGDYCSTDDCYYGNCKATASRPNWDGQTTQYGDPTLDVDDLSGYGPENINIDSPVDGTYRVGVHFFSGSTQTYVTAKIFLNGALRAEYTRQFTADDDFWEVADVQWSAGAAIVIPVDGFETDWSCY